MSRQFFDLHSEPFEPIEPGDAAGGDLAGSYPDPTVAKIKGVAITDAAAAGEALVATGANAAEWQAPDGDLSGSFPNPSVVKLQGAVALSGAASSNAVLTATGAAAATWLPPAESIQSFADIDALSNFDDARMAAGSLVYVQSLRSYFQKGPYKVVAVPTVTEVECFSDAGTWYRLSEASVSWSTANTVGNAASWYINSSTGNDENDGSAADAAHALASVAELCRRLVYLQRGTIYNVYFGADVLASDYATFTNRVLLGSGNFAPLLVLIGTETATPSVTQLSAITQTDGAAGTQASATDAARVWSLPTNAAPTPTLIRFMNGSAYNYAYVLKDLTGGVARLSHIFTIGASTFSIPTIAGAPPAAPLSYDLITLTKWSAPANFSGDINVYFRAFDFADLPTSRFYVSSLSINHNLCFMTRVNYTSGSTTYSSPLRIGSGSTTIAYNGCILGSNDANATFSASNPGGLISCSVSAILGISLSMNNTSLAQGWGISNCSFHGGTSTPAPANRQGRILNGATGGPTVGGAAFALSGIVSFFDWQQAGGAIEVGFGATILGTSLTSLFGSQNAAYAGYGIRVRNNGKFLIAAITPKLYGANGGYDIDIDGLSGATGSSTAPVQRILPNALWSATAATNGASVAITGVNGAGWTTWAAARATPGFERTLVSHVTGASIIGVI